MVLNKKGQAVKDIFGDLWLAALLFVIAIMLVIPSSNLFKVNVNKGMEDIASLDVKNDLSTILNTKLENLDLGKEGLGKLKELGLNLDSSVMDFLYVMAKTQSQDRIFEFEKAFSKKFVSYDSRVVPVGHWLEYSFTSFSGVKKLFYVAAVLEGTLLAKETIYSYSSSVGRGLNGGMGYGLESDDKYRKECFRDIPALKGEKYEKIYGVANIKSINYDGIIKIELKECKWYLRGVGNG